MKKRFIIILLSVIVLATVLVVLFKAYCHFNEYWYSVGQYLEVDQRPAIRVDYSPYFKYGIKERIIYMHPEDETMFQKIESGDVIFVVHEGIVQQDICTTIPVQCIKIK